MRQTHNERQSLLFGVKIGAWLECVLLKKSTWQISKQFGENT
ncbi:hypothetical protein [Pseudoalteromonas citrea]|nr:hypothetical protein [Pseudoalteromonas citrea]